MEKRYSYEVVETVHPRVEYSAKPYRIIEKFITCDGVRSRLTDRCYKTLSEAKAECDRLDTTQ